MCNPLFLTVAGIGLLSVGTCLGFITAALFATGAEPARLANPKMAISIPDETAELVWQAAESLYTLASCLREGEDPFGPMADAARALHRVADRFPVLLRDAGWGLALPLPLLDRPTTISDSDFFCVNGLDGKLSTSEGLTLDDLVTPPSEGVPSASSV
jgi:hypothetical protein